MSARRTVPGTRPAHDGKFGPLRRVVDAWERLEKAGVPSRRALWLAAIANGVDPGSWLVIDAAIIAKNRWPAGSDREGYWFWPAGKWLRYATDEDRRRLGPRMVAVARVMEREGGT